jgi:uncharacterized membrane protein YkoI
MFGFFKRRKVDPATRLSRDAAVSIAQRAVSGDPLAAELSMTSVEQRDGRAVWLVSTATVGRRIIVVIDDASGDVLDKQHLGGR